MSEIEEMKLKYSINYFGTDSALWNDLQKLFRHISTLEEEMKELESQIKPITYQKEVAEKENKILWEDIRQSESRIKDLQEERDGYKNGQIQLSDMVNDLMDVTAKWAEKVKELEKTNNERLNLIDEWETKYNELNGFLGKAFTRIGELEKGIAIHEDLELRLERAIDRHEIFKRTHEKVVALEDEALYQKRKEV